METLLEIIDIMDKFTIVFAFVIMFTTLYSAYIAFKGRNEIALIIQEPNGKIITLPHKILRKNFTRAEIFGVLGALDKDSKFEIKHTASKVFFADILAIQKGNKDEIIIKISENDKFDWQDL